MSLIKHFLKEFALFSLARNLRERQLRLKYYKRDLLQKLRYGIDAPIYQERIWILPEECQYGLESKAIQKLTGLEPRKASGLVIRHDWPSRESYPVMENPKMTYCIKHWVNGQSWEQAGAYNYIEQLIERYGMVDNCKTREDVIERFNNLDNLFEQIKEQGRIPTRKEFNPDNFREKNGILVHLGPKGQPFFGEGGFHRFAIAKILNLPMPAVIGCVHIGAINSLKDYRTPERVNKEISNESIIKE